MRRAQLVVAALVLDILVGDPPQLPHPVRAIGWSIATGERLIRSRIATARQEFVGGAGLSVGVVVVSALFGVAIERSGSAARVVGAASTLALRDLLREAAIVAKLLEANDLPASRTALARIVGRDTHALDPSQIARAAIETLAESLCDGVIAPLLALAIGGLPLALAYKAINTLDSMIGHRNARYLRFGRFAARWDDLANYVPARATAACIAVAAAILEGSGGSALRVWLAQGSLHASPNAGQSEAAMSGALHVCLGGTNSYAGVEAPGAMFGATFRDPEPRDIRRAMRVVVASAVLAALGAIAIARWTDG